MAHETSLQDMKRARRVFATAIIKSARGKATPDAIWALAQKVRKLRHLIERRIEVDSPGYLPDIYKTVTVPMASANEALGGAAHSLREDEGGFKRALFLARKAMNYWLAAERSLKKLSHSKSLVVKAAQEMGVPVKRKIYKNDAAALVGALNGMRLAIRGIEMFNNFHWQSGMDSVFDARRLAEKVAPQMVRHISGFQKDFRDLMKIKQNYDSVSLPKLKKSKERAFNEIARRLIKKQRLLKNVAEKRV